MPSCPRCGFWRGRLQLRKDGLYECSNCHDVYRSIMGIALEPIPGLSPFPLETRTCSYCGSPIADPDSRFCFNCGTKIVHGSPTVAIPAYQKEDAIASNEEMGIVHGATAAKLSKTGETRMVCKLPLEGTDSLTWCPHCGNVAHKVHLLEWLHVKDFCPMCSRHLDENELRQQLSKMDKTLDLKTRRVRLPKGNHGHAKEK